MTLRVSLATGSTFLSIVIRQTLGRMRQLELVREDRDVAAALQTLQRHPDVAIVDADLLADPVAGATLCQLLAARRAPSIVIDARARGIPSGLATRPSLRVVSGPHGGELNLGMMAADLCLAIDHARLQRASASPLRLPVCVPRFERPEAHRGSLDCVVIGVSTGGPTLLLSLLKRLDKPAMSFLIVQHMPESETASFAARLAEESGHAIVEAAAGVLPGAGTIGVLRGGRDFRLVRNRTGILQLRDAELPGNPFHPNIDELLRSAVAAGVALGAAILTGMGQDGTQGALAMAQQGLPVIAQRPDTCAVAGMPQSVIDSGAARLVQSPEAIVSTLNKWSAQRRRGLAGEAR